ncbi:hypothetical protein F5Y12DRAFT_176199 [Xylaria sp. FL1777]|nr:hypothetical protein F5Y12DRAFT_176199 [Xylaria sp. FL1777]
MAKDVCPAQYLISYSAPLVLLFSTIVLISFKSTHRAATSGATDDKTVMTNPAVESWPLPADAVSETDGVANWLRSEDANFQTVDQIKICKNINGLSTATAKLSEHFTEEIRSRLPNGRAKPSQTRVSAIHFENPTAVPLEPGWVMELIPIYTVQGTVEVGGQQHSPNTYFHLTSPARVSGNFFGLLLLSQIP